ncbi:MAG: NfeD family protein [candidate division Zixibacteria bacterium CG_4_9_14_3_um_filter_46_8]|nr:MAG: NfeD family protein [candidate division Zixibacteria bacterium CG_4_9_14_3_um_filter_46_8]
MQAWHVWVIIGIILSILEIFTPGFMMINFGVGAIIAGLIAAIGAGFKVQVLTFALSSLILFASSRKLVSKYLSKDKPEARTNVDALVSRQGVVIEAIKANLKHGRVKIGGEEWSAISSSEMEISMGEKVVVTGIEGNKLIVKKVE